ncbi:MAG: hypothetical protein ACLUBZ_17025 [Ruthenibacterium lactatiformans]|uniref:hypothetical protein n=3 Tax=Ruthenibacterium lactatiformans TaxID=1550024 RepID=UPI00399198BB
MDDAAERGADGKIGDPLLNLQGRFTVMTKEEMFKEMEKMAPVLERNGVDIVLGKRIPGSFTRGYFFNEEAGLWEVYSCGERNEYFVRKQTGSEQEAVEKLYRMAKYEYESALRHLERERQRKERMQNGQR